MLLIALLTDLPRYVLGSLSLSSRASSLPVDAPDGTAPLPIVPSSRTISASHVGLPRESIICLPNIFFMVRDVIEELWNVPFDVLQHGVVQGKLPKRGLWIRNSCGLL